MLIAVIFVKSKIKGIKTGMDKMLIKICVCSPLLAINEIKDKVAPTPTEPNSKAVMNSPRFCIGLIETAESKINNKMPMTNNNRLLYIILLTASSTGLYIWK